VQEVEGSNPFAPTETHEKTSRRRDVFVLVGGFPIEGMVRILPPRQQIEEPPCRKGGFVLLIWKTADFQVGDFIFGVLTNGRKPLVTNSNTRRLKMTPKLFVVTLWAEAVAQTAHFYRDVIGLPLVLHHDRPHFDLGGIFLTILKGKSTQESIRRFPCVAFSVDNLDTAIQRLESHHVELPFGVEEDEETRWVMFYDPGGNLIELAEIKKGG
jgi:catechol 2,3-dioxygenase-like lactoylglutathione lyase family enzyme